MAKRKADKGTRAESLHERAEACRAWARAACEKRNMAAEKAALARFEKGPVAKLFREECKRAIGILVFQMKGIRVGECPEPFGEQDDISLERLLSATTTAECSGWSYDVLLSDEETVRKRRAHTLLRDNGTSVAQTDASRLQSLLRKALFDFAFAAAVYAKHTKSASILQWAEILDTLGRVCPDFAYAFSAAKAARLVALKNAASDCLRFEEIVARLPSFGVRKKAVR